jgi:hypothetical protein
MSLSKTTLNKITAKNDLYSAINKVMPQIIKYGMDGFKIKSNGYELFNKDHKAIRDILSQCEFKCTPAFNISSQTLIIEFKTRYDNGEGSGGFYIEKHVYIGNGRMIDFESLPIVTIEQYENAQNRINDIDTAMEKLIDEKSSLNELMN